MGNRQNQVLAYMLECDLAAAAAAAALSKDSTQMGSELSNKKSDQS